MPRGPAANWNRHQYKKAAMLVYATAASAGSRGNVGKLCPAGHGESDQRAGAETGFSGFHFSFHIPLADQFRRRPAKPQRLVQFQHGIPAFALRASARRANFKERRTPVRPGPIPFHRRRADAEIGAPIFPRREIPVSARLHRLRRGGSTPPSRRGLCRRPLGLQTLTVKSRLLPGENSVRIRGDPPFLHPW